MNRQKGIKALIAFMLMLSVSHLTSAQTLKQTLGVSNKREYSGFFDSYYYRGPLAITGGIGTSLFLGDLTKTFYGAPKVAFNLGANYKFWPRTVFGIEYHHFGIGGTSSDSIAPATFKGSGWGLNFYGRLYLIEDIIRKSPDRRTNKKVKPYITTGIGFIRFKSVGTYSSKTALTAAFPVGLGFECKVSPRLQVVPEISHFYTFNDRMDATPTGKWKDGYTQIVIKIQYAPFAPRKKKKLVTAPADPNQHREEHQEWRKKKEQPKPPVEELPQENTEEQPTDENTEEQPTEEETPKEEKPEGQ